MFSENVSTFPLKKEEGYSFNFLQGYQVVFGKQEIAEYLDKGVKRVKTPQKHL